MFAIVRSLCSGWQSVRPMIFRYGYRDSRKSNTRHTGPVCESKTQFNDVHSRYKSTSFICSVRFFLDTIRARRPLRLKTNDGILIAGRWCHSSAHQKCWGDWAPGGYLPFRWKTRMFRMEHQMDCAIPFVKLQKTWAVTWGDAIFLLFLVCSSGLDMMLCNGSFSHDVKFYSFMFMHKIFTRVVFENGKHSGSCCWDFWDRIVTSTGLLVPLRHSSIPRKILGLMAGAWFLKFLVGKISLECQASPLKPPCNNGGWWSRSLLLKY